MADTARAAMRPLDRLARWPKSVALASGIAAGLGQVPFSLLPLALFALAAAYVQLARAPSPRSAGLTGWWIGTGYFATTLHWIVEPFMVDPVRHAWMAPFALVLISTGFALFWGAAFALVHRISRPGLSRVIAFAVCLGGAEVARSYLLSGFPWALVGYVWSETGGAQLAAWIGSFGLSVLTLLLAAVAGQGALRRPMLGAALLALAWAVPLVLGGVRMGPVPPVDAAAPLVRIVQPNAPQHQKWDPAFALTFYERQLRYTAASGDDGRPDLTIWPETSIPYLTEPGHPALRDIAEVAGNRPVALGAQRVSDARAYNSMLLLGPEGRIEEVYDKHHLVPFGEFVPLGGLARLVGLRSMAARDGYGFSAGPGPRLVDFGPLGRALPLICYEAIFPQDLRGTERPDWLLQITNDAWFGTFSGPFQHLAQARMRAIEQGLPMVRVANTGVSGLIDRFGRLTAHLPLGEAGFLDVRLPPPGAPTLYARTGDLPLVVLLVLLSAALIWHARRLGD